jgi:transglutaminase-like putative cysteine protease
VPNLYPTPPPSQLQGLPSGIAGVKATLKQMAALVRQYKTDSGIHLLARQLTSGLPNQNQQGASILYVSALQQFVRDRIRYVQDVESVETLQTPPYTLQVAAGDCDDKAILLDTLLASVGYATAFFAIGLNGGPYQHVLAGVKLGTRLIPLETIVPNAAPGWMPPNASPVFTWNV